MANSLSSVLGLAGLSGGGGVPPGSFVVVPRAPLNFTDGAAEYLRTGNIKTYSSGYDAALDVAPQLGVFGSNTKQHNSNIGTAVQYYAYIGSNYVSSDGYYSSDLDTWSVTSLNFCQGVRPVVGNGYMVCANAVANTPLRYSTNGSTFSNVGGGFVTCPLKSALCYAPSVGWLALSSLEGSTGSVYYINNTNPTGNWTPHGGSFLGMSRVSAVAYGNGVFVAVGVSNSVTEGKIATCATLGGAWTDRTVASGLITLAGTIGMDVVFTGTHFVANFSNGVVARSTDGITWTVVLRENVQQVPARAATNGSGTVVITPNATTGSAATQPVFWVSQDHGASFVQRQIYVGKIAAQNNYAAPSYANGQFFINHAGHYASPQEIGQAYTPDFVGWQNSVNDPTNISQYCVRIK